MEPQRLPALSLVIPLYNEGAHLHQVIDRVVPMLEICEPDHELLLVDDGSPDNTWSAICKHTDSNPRIHGLRLSRNFGKEAALAAGLEQARGHVVIIMDGDLQHPPELIPKMLELHRRDGVPIVEAYKKESSLPLVSHLYYRLLAGLSGRDLNGATDFKLLSRKAVDAWKALGERNIFFRGMASWLGFERARLEFTVPERVGGASRWSLFQLIRLAVTGVTSFSSLPLQITTGIGVLFLIFSFVVGGQTLYMKFFGDGVDGFTTVILLILITGSCILISLGVIGLYLARIYEEVKARPRYLLAETRTSKDAPDEA